MLISEMKITACGKSDRKIRAFVSLTFDGMLAIERIRLVDNGEKQFIAMPNGRKADTGEFFDYVFPINATVREALENLVFGGYNYLVENGKYKVIFKCKEDCRDGLLDQSLDDFSIFAEVDDLNK